MSEQEKEIQSAIELLNKNGYIVAKVSNAQLAIAKQCRHSKDRCNFNLLGIKCVDLLCVQELIRNQVLPYAAKADEEENNE